MKFKSSALRELFQKDKENTMPFIESGQEITRNSFYIYSDFVAEFGGIVVIM